jgi:arginine decarboxylase
MPIQRLDERPERNVTLQDITCDSDGKITQYVNSMQQTAYIPMHTIHRGERYYVGVFLVGAYQEILGNMHNLFGDTNAVHVTVTDNGYSIDRVIEGETVAEVLDYVQYDPKRLQRRLETWVKRAELAGKISISEGNEFLANYRSGLYGYTYLELNDEDLYRENDRVRYKDKKSEKQEDKDDEK